MIEEIIDGKRARFYLESCGVKDGVEKGQIVVCLVETTTPNKWSSYRHWYNDPALAKSVFDGMGAEGKAYRAGEATAKTRTGSTVGVKL